MVTSIGVNFGVMVELLSGQVFSFFGGDIFGVVTKCGAKKGARVDHFRPLRHRFLPFDREYLENGIIKHCGAMHPFIFLQ